MNIYQGSRLQLAATVFCGLLLGGCLGGGGSGSDPGGTTSISLSGTAATGSGINNATITASCADGSGFIQTVSTGADGSWSGEIASSSALPCALQLTGGTPNITLHSLATQAGTVNITPLTDLALGLQINLLSGQTLTDWFAAPREGGSNLASLSSTLTEAADTLRGLLLGAGFTLPANWSAGATTPFNAPFVADPATDPYDQLLESLAESIAEDVNLADYPALLSSIVAGASFPSAPGSPPAGGGTVAATINPQLVGNTTLIFKAGIGEGCGTLCSFTENQQVPVVVNADNSLVINGKTLTNPYYRLFSNTPNRAEIIWKDGNIEYALTNNESGEFSEINIGDSARPNGPFNVPTFIGQLRENVISSPASALIGPLAGSYSPVVVEKSSRFTGNSSLPLGDTVEVIVSNDGVVSIDGYEFDPSQPTYDFFNASTSTSQPELYYQATVTEAEGVTLSLAILLDANDRQPVAWRLTRTTQLGPGSFSVSKLDLEERPIPQDVNDFFTDLKALSPVVLTLVVDEPTFSSGLALCDQVVLTLEGDGSVTSPWTYDLNPPGFTTPGAATGALGFDVYRRSYARYSDETGSRRLALRLRSRDLLLTDDGQLDLVVRSFEGVERDRATTDLTQISSAGCTPP
ncbi:hypothetical protein [uncultured Halopseudomonas sp.]|uniref:hypothetical protein n=1 Tax=uncultured Halopseudomonas sp. TaxID=2901193 RepID=UPI0030EBC6C7|tara:strand:- start:4570 stop:6477 length:1908 start_codon:yes stop_codon:yes gene_type:complete